MTIAGMLFTEHEKLIKTLEDHVKAGPPADGFVEPHFKQAWALIKKIGPSFKDTLYPNRAERDARWRRFQATVEQVKARQKEWENTSAAKKEELLALFEKAKPTRTTMADLLGDPAASDTRPAVAEAVDAAKPETKSRKDELNECSAACDAALVSFMEAKRLLCHAHYKSVSDGFRSLRQDLQKAWNEFRKEARAEHFERLARKADPRARWEKQEWSLPTPAEQLENDEACLASKQRSLASFQKLLLGTTDEAEAKRLRTWIAENEEAIAELEASIRDLKAKMGSAGQP